MEASGFILKKLGGVAKKYSFSGLTTNYPILRSLNHDTERNLEKVILLRNKNKSINIKKGTEMQIHLNVSIFLQQDTA